MKKKIIIENGVDLWDAQKRYKVNQSVLYDGVSYQNTTGGNSQPNLLVDWQKIDDSFKLTQYQVQTFNYVSGVQEFTPANGISSVLALFVQGQQWDKPTQWTNDATKITVLDTLQSPVVVSIIYTDGNVGVLPTYTQTQIDDFLAEKADITDPLIITDTFVVGSQVEMLALTAQKGDIAIRTDLSKTFVLKNNAPTILANWEELLSPTGGLVSVNGQTGVVVLDADDIATTPTREYASPIEKAGWNAKANDADVLHKTGNETKTGNLTILGTLSANDVTALLKTIVGDNVTANQHYIELLGKNNTSVAEIQGFQTAVGVSALRLQKQGGALLIGNIVDNGVDKLQVEGTISASPATTANQVVVKSQLDLKQNILTNPITGTGTTNRLSKFTAAGVIGDSSITDTGGTVTVTANLSIRPQASNINFVNGQTLKDNGVAGISITAPAASVDIISGTNATGAVKIFTNLVSERLRVINNGNVLINSIVDNTQGKLQVDGNITALPATLSNQVVTLGQLPKKQKEVKYKFSGAVPQNTLFGDNFQEFLYQGYNLKKVTVVFGEQSMNVNKTIPILISLLDTDSASPAVTTAYTADCNAVIGAIQNKRYIFDINVALTANKLLTVGTGAFTASTQILNNCLVTLVLEEI